MSTAKSKKNENIADLIQFEGVDCKGYGIIAKAVMTDTDLNITAKAIYAYFCSFTGKGTIAFPKREKILYDLQINKMTYYKHLNQLIEEGYIKIEKQKQYPFNNRYIIVSCPKKLEKMNESVENVDVIVKGIKSLGYGTIPKAVMQDHRLSCKAKAVYAYFCSFAGQGNFAFPKRNSILYHLHISLNSFQKLLHQLIECNYITVEQKRDGGQFSGNTYYINDLPDEEKGKNEMKKRAALQNKKANTRRKNAAKKKGLVNLPTQHGHAQKSTFTGAFNYPGIKKKQKIIDDTTKDDPQIKVSYDEKNTNLISAEEREFYTEIIKENIEYENGMIDPSKMEYMNLILSVMVNAVCSREPYLRVNKQDVPQESVKSKLLKLDDGNVEYVIENMSKMKTMPRNLRAYLLTALYNAPDSTDLYYTLAVKHWCKSEQDDISYE